MGRVFQLRDGNESGVCMDCHLGVLRCFSWRGFGVNILIIIK